MKKYKVGIIGATGMVGQRFCKLLENHPWFEIVALAASSRSKGKTLKETWKSTENIPANLENMLILDATIDVLEITNKVDFVFCAVEMDKEATKTLEELYAKNECPVVSNNSANRLVSDVPMIIPELNPEHLDVIEHQRKRLGTKKGFIAVKSNCSIQSYVPALTALKEFEPTEVAVSTYQAISGAGKTFSTWPEMIDNVIPFINGEEEKSEAEPLKIWGKIVDGAIENTSTPKITAQCIRVPVSDGHMSTVFVKFKHKPTINDILVKWNNFTSECNELPSSPKKFITYFEEENRPQTNLDRNLHNGMGISIGRLREDNIFDYKFVSLSHNTLRGAAGGAVLLAELLCDKNYIKQNRKD